MSISPDTQAVLLLTAHFSEAPKGVAKPLTPKEWGRFALWLKEKSLTPEHLMVGRLSEHLNGWSDEAITLNRIESLMERGVALGLAVEKWLRAGLWVMTRSDPDYPKRLKKHLGMDAPAVLFGCGNKKLLNRGGLAVVGSRKVTEEDWNYAHTLGDLVANSGHSIISGGARGIDEASMLGALEVEGMAVGILANSLLHACTGAKYRNYLMENNLVLISPFYPDAGFNVGNAMQRNKYIYCLSNAAAVVHSGTSGGTWNGALENLKKGWVPVWVKETTDGAAGNAAIVEAGAKWMPADPENIDFETLLPYPAYMPPKEPEPVPDLKVIDGEEPAGKLEFYDLFLIKVESLCEDSPKSEDEIMELAGLNRTQFRAWIKQAVSDKAVTKNLKPVRYQWARAKEAKSDLKTSDKKKLEETLDLYDLFLNKVEALCGNSPKTADALVKNLNLSKSQLDAWLKRAVAGGEIAKPKRGHYQRVTQQQDELPI